MGIAALLELASGGEVMGGQGYLLLPGVALLMTAVGLLAAWGPARRGLGIQPMAALREEGPAAGRAPIQQEDFT